MANLEPASAIDRLEPLAGKPLLPKDVGITAIFRAVVRVEKVLENRVDPKNLLAFLFSSPLN
jgi:hypothetical protein